MKVPEGQASQVQVPKEDEVSQKLELKKTEPEPSTKLKEFLVPDAVKSIEKKGKSTMALPSTKDILQDLHHSQVQLLENQKITPIPIVLKQFSTAKLPYEGIPFVQLHTSSLNAETQAEARVRTILSALNTISTATVSLIEEVKPCDHVNEIQELNEKVQKSTQVQETLEDQVIDLQQQLEREQRLVKHSNKMLDKYKNRYLSLKEEKDQLAAKVRRLQRNKIGFEVLTEELALAINKHYVSESLASVLKTEESEDSIHFNLNELQELEEGLITKIQNCSEEHNNPLFREFLLRYLEEKYKDAPKEEEEDEATDKEDEDKDDDEGKDDDEEGKDDDDDSEDDDDQEGPSGKESQKPTETEKDDDEEPPPHVKEVKIKRFNDKSSLKGKQHSSTVHSSQTLSLSEVLQEGENAMYWKAVAMKQMFNKWELKTQLAHVNAYMQKTFIKKFGKPVEAKEEEYPPKAEGVVQLVLAPSMQRIKSILPEQLNMCLSKAWIQKIQKQAEGQPRVVIALSYLEYLIRIQRDYEDMERRYNVVRKQEFVHAAFQPDTQDYQLALLQEQAVELMKTWPTYNMHCEAKCQIPPHPSQIQIVDMTEGYRVATADLQNSPAIRKLQTSSVSQFCRYPLIFYLILDLVGRV